MADCLIHESREGVIRLTLNRPQRRNAHSLELLLRLEDSLGAIRADRSARVVVLAGEGPIFSSGHDLAELTRSTGQGETSPQPPDGGSRRPDSTTDRGAGRRRNLAR